MAKLKRLLLWGGILLIGGILMLGAAANEMMSSILGDNQQTNITEDMLNGLPDWITPEMVQGAIDMMHENGYPASVVLGQMILEGGAGGSELSNPPYYNCLGQKSPSYGENGTVTMQTEEAWGTVTAVFSTFASYKDCMLAWAHKFTMPPSIFYYER